MQIVRQILVLLLCWLITSCEFEPFEGDSLADSMDENTTTTDGADADDILDEDGVQEDEVPFSTGSLQYKINGRSFISDQTNGTVDPQMISIIGVDKDSGEGVQIELMATGLGTYQLNGENTAFYLPNFTDDRFSTAVNNGSGMVKITKFDTVGREIDGTFYFTANRAVLDEEGNPVNDADGSPIYEEVSLLEGLFEEVSYN